MWKILINVNHHIIFFHKEIVFDKKTWLHMNKGAK